MLSGMHFAAPINRLVKLARPSRRLAAVAAFVAIAIIVGIYLGLFYEGHSPRYWLLQAYSTDAQKHAKALRAFEQMGARGDAALLAALQTNEPSLVSHAEWFLTPRGRNIYQKLPARVQRAITDYYFHNYPSGLRNCAECLAHESKSRSLAPKLLPLLTNTDEDFRMVALGAMLGHLGPDNVTGAQLRPLRATAYDQRAAVRLRTAICLAEAGPCATNELITLCQLCADKDAAVRVGGAWALDQINAANNAPVLLAQALHDYAYGGGGEFIGWEVYNEWPEAKMKAMTQALAELCLTNAAANVRASACLVMNSDPLSSRKDVTMLTQLLNDPDAKVRKEAAAALKSINGSGRHD